METVKEIIDITLPIYNGMWSYRPEWSNTIATISATANGDASTVYNFNIYSHTGTYIETSQHKLNNKLLLHDFGLESFYGDCFVVVISRLEDNVVTHASFLKALNGIELTDLNGSKLIIATGYGTNHSNVGYLKNVPSFEPKLTQILIELNLKLLGVDTPIIENQTKPYQPVVKLFEKNERLLLLAPLQIDIKQVKTGRYILSCLPSFKCEISGSPTRAFLIKK